MMCSRTVVAGSVVVLLMVLVLGGCEEALETPELSFEGNLIEDQSYIYREGTAIRELTLPAASGGSGGVTYRLTPAVPGLRFDTATRTLSGTPSAEGTYTMAYTATDGAGADVALMFRIVIAPVGFRDCVDCPLMVEVPSGTYTMGAPSWDVGRVHDGGPQHTVTIEYRLAVSVYEVTFAEWDACVADGGCNGYMPDDAGSGRGTRPVVNVNWDDAQGYVQWLSEKAKKPYRLPSESEWEYVARAWTTTRYHTGSTISPAQSNYWPSKRKTMPVGSYPANAFGLHDVHGNVSEWTQDCWNDSYTGAPTDGSAWESGYCLDRMVRGGSFRNYSIALRSAYRFWYETGVRSGDLGFRVARTLGPQIGTSLPLNGEQTGKPPDAGWTITVN